ncbi:MAG: T9SS type A sorting domain-containing protein [Rhodothermales bacterium]
MSILPNRASRSFVLLSGLPAFLVLAFVPLLASAQEVYDVVALRVEFQADTTRFTTGDGTFGGNLFGEAAPPKVDPLPHDAGYFAAHLTFLENYVRRVSDGKAEVRTHLLPDIVRVSGKMGAYSPTGFDSNSDEELEKLARLPVEAWALAEASGVALPAGLDPDRTAFLIFHAGVGRDIELVGTTLDKTPEDLPSIFFNRASFDRLGVTPPSVSGMTVENTILLPRTETRLGFDFLADEPFLIELSINGLMAASFLNFLGAPDLFNTETGDSAIGPFGVMDALGIFAFRGLFPPEPSAFTKRFLGWDTTLEAAPLTAEGQTYGLRHSGDALRNDMLRVPISDAEYFLVENRHRDPDGDGVRMTVWTHEGVKEVVFANGAEDFNDVTISGFPGGVVMDVDDFDFALPGGIDENGNALLGGALVWHVDENRLRQTLQANRVNADPDARSVDLEEADGAQDIGFSGGGGFFGPNFGLGTPFDFFFEGNPVSVRTTRGQDIRLYENRFGAGTYPDARSNAGGEARLSIEDFSVPGPDMTVRVVGVATTLASLPDQSVALDAGTGSLPPDAYFVRIGRAGTVGWLGAAKLQAGVYRLVSETGASRDVLGQPVITSAGAVAIRDGQFVRWDGTAAEPVSLGGGATAPILEVTTDIVGGPNGSWMAGVLLADGLYGRLAFRDGTHDLEPVSGRMLAIGVAPDGQRMELLADRVQVDGVDAWVLPRPVSGSAQVVFGQDADGPTAVVVDGSAMRLGAEGRVDALAVPCAADAGHLVDLDGDGWLETVVACTEWVWVFSRTGAVMDGFPVALPAAFAGGLSVWNALNDVRGGFMMRLMDGSLMAWTWDGAGSVPAGFPLSAGLVAPAAPVLLDDALYAVSGGGRVSAWRAPALAGARLTDEAGNQRGAGTDVRYHGNRRFVEADAPPAPTSPSSRLLVPDDVYNWPNPVQDGVTRLRAGVTEQADVRMQVVDLAGRIVETMDLGTLPAGGVAEVVWTPSVGSGIYMVRVEATGAAGRTDTHMYKLAIIR